jgi:iron complex transport system ATP-binding protein
MAYLQQLSLLNFPYTVEEVILLGRSPHDTGTSLDAEILKEVLQLTDTGHLQDRLYTQLSGGEKQRVQLARIFSQIWHSETLEGKLLLLDEPTAALDIQHQQSTCTAIRGLADKGCAVVVVIHDFNAITAIADQLIVLHRGRQYVHGAPRDVFTENLFRDVFAADVVIGKHPYRDQPMIIPR